MQNIILYISIAVLIGLFIYVISLLKKSQENKGNDQSMNMLLNQINELSRTVDSKMGETTKMVQNSMQNQMTESQRLMRDINNEVTKHLVSVTKEITQANESSKQVVGIAEQLQNLEKVLKNQKQRGNLGEAGLELILSNMLPADAYELQYQFSNNEKADAIIKTKDGIIAVDAKFSLENYNRLINEDDESKKEALEKEFKNDLKKRIDETAKYIRPNEKTLPFAFMFIPAEGIYYDLLVNEVGSSKVNTRSLIDYAYNDKKVIIVSPTTFSAYLQSVLYGFKAYKIEESAKLIGKKVEELGRHLKRYDELHGKLGASLGTVVNHYNNSTKEFGKIEKDILKISGAELSLESTIIEKPAEKEGE